jgi:hypothetical protein
MGLKLQIGHLGLTTRGTEVLHQLYDNYCDVLLKVVETLMLLMKMIQVFMIRGEWAATIVGNQNEGVPVRRALAAKSDAVALGLLQAQSVPRFSSSRLSLSS